MNHKGISQKKGKLLDQLRAACRLQHLSLRTEKAYTGWVRRYVHFHNLRHPISMGEAEIRSFLTYLAQERNVAASTQNQALHALLFLYTSVLEQPIDDLGPIVRARRPKRLPVVLTRDEVNTLLHHLPQPHKLIAGLLYGSGLRLLESLRLRVKDLDFSQQQIVIRDGKGQKDRYRRTHVAKPSDATISTSQPFRKPSTGPLKNPASPSRPPATPSATASPRTCSKMEPTSERCKSYWATRMCAPR